MKDAVKMEYDGVQMDEDGFLHFKEGEFDRAPEWKKWVVGLMNRMRDAELAKEGK